jgi:K+-sensing histidine kinase KdpD|tara:strand:- start:60 stop:464 length:405 start_codon:yes stop_codon:yes gene_type:complete
MMEALKTYAKQNFEQVFILLILTSVVVINYLIPFKLVFLNLYFIVILLGTFYMELRKAVLGGVLCTLLVIIHVYYFPSFFMPAITTLDLWMSIVVWSGFLILTGSVVGKLISGLKTEVEQLKEKVSGLEAQADL